jgi:hypothetical protein
MKLSFYEIFDQVGKAKTKAEKQEILRRFSGPALKQVLGMTYNPNIKWLLPEGEPPYKPLKSGSDMEGRLESELRRLYLFVEGTSDTQRNLKQVRRESLFIDLLESIDPGDAKVLLGMKEGKLPFKGLTKKLVAETFPKLSTDW